MWTRSILNELFEIDLPIVQAPMAGAGGAAMAIAVSEAGGLGSLPCAMLDHAKIRAEVGVIQQQTRRPFNLNFFCHSPPVLDPAREVAWRRRLDGYYQELGLDPASTAVAPQRTPFDEKSCAIVEDLRPKIVSFHFGLPEPALMTRVKAAGCKVISSATTVAEARWLAAHGCDAIIAQGFEAGGHRGMFLSDDLSTQIGTMALVPQVVDAIDLPVIAAGGIADGRGIAAALALGAAGVQIGTAYLFTQEALISGIHRVALSRAADHTALTNLFSGRPARGVVNRLMAEIGPLSKDAPAFPTAGEALAPLKAAAEKQGRDDFSSLWSGQAAALCRAAGAFELTRHLAEETRQQLRRICSS